MALVRVSLVFHLSYFCGVRSVGMSERGHKSLPSVTVVIPTFRRERDVYEQAARFAAMELVSRVLVVDQGGSLTADAAFADLVREQPHVHLITQPNLGGSGGYARGMLESLAWPEDAVFLSDDDAQITEESLRRMLTYQALASRPTIIGTGMFSAERPTELVSHAEAVREPDFMWGPVDGVREPIDVAGTTPDQWDFLEQHQPINYTGWWGTLLPPGTVADLGLPAPYFLKWDDAEYGLRATRRGYDHAVIPGASVWHPTWGAHATQMSWTARIMHRNRLATAAAYGAGRGVIASSLLHQIKHILGGHYLTAQLWASGIDAFLCGPGSWLGTDLLRARSDGQVIVDAWNRDQPEPPPANREGAMPVGTGALRAITRLLFGHRAGSPVVIEVPAADVTWRTTLGADTVIMTAQEGAVGTLTADPLPGRALLRQAFTQHRALAKRWRQLSRSYGKCLTQVTTIDAWREMIAAAESETDAPA